MSYQPEERYWTDYLRIALPVAGLLILIGLLWYWASALIGQSSGEAPITPSAIAGITPISAVASPAAPTATAVLIQPTPGLPVVATATAAPAVVVTQAPAAPTAAPVVAQEPTEAPSSDSGSADVASCDNLPVYDVGAHVQTTDSGVRLRDAPTTDGQPIQEMDKGTELVIDGNFTDAGEGQCDWWPVTVVSSGVSGFVREDFIAPVS